MKTKTWIIILLLLTIVMFATNPEKEKLYKQVLEEEAGMGDQMLAELKYTIVETKYDYKNYYLFGTLGNEKEGVAYLGIFTKVIRL